MKRTLAAVGACVCWLGAAALAAVLLLGCGAATVTAGAACSSLLLIIGERADYSAERAHADLDAQSEICSRLAAPRSNP